MRAENKAAAFGVQTLLLASAFALTSACSSGGEDEAVPRATIDADWPTIPDDAKFGQVSAVDVDSHGHVFVLHRARVALTDVKTSFSRLCQSKEILVKS